jgi:DNA-binding protein HU-beta
MNKTELIKAVAERTEMKKVEVEKVLNGFMETVEEALASGDKVQLVGFGNFEVRERAARKGRNPQTGEEIDISASKVPAFKAGSKLKEAIKNS